MRRAIALLLLWMPIASGCAARLAPAAGEALRVSAWAQRGDPQRRASTRMVIEGLEASERGREIEAVSRFERAQIGVVGRAGLVDRDYDQVAVVSASFGNALPVVGAALGGPAVAAVVLIFSQIFKKPLSEVGQVYYGISGSWDEPVIDTVTAEQFAEQGVRAGCLEETD